MRRRRPGLGPFSKLLIAAGTLILLVIVMPGAFWWFAFGVALILIGIWFFRCC